MQSWYEHDETLKSVEEGVEPDQPDEAQGYLTGPPLYLLIANLCLSIFLVGLVCCWLRSFALPLALSADTAGDWVRSLMAIRTAPSWPQYNPALDNPTIQPL